MLYAPRQKCTADSPNVHTDVHQVHICWVPIELTSVDDALRRAGGDSASVEVESAAGGHPESLTATLSALANLPGRL